MGEIVSFRENIKIKTMFLEERRYLCPISLTSTALWYPYKLHFCVQRRNFAHLLHTLCSEWSTEHLKGFTISLFSPPQPPYSYPCQMQALPLRQGNLETEHLMQLSFQNRLTCVECQKEPCCATAPTCLGKIEIARCLTLWMISQLLTCPICSSQLSLICFSLCVCSGTNKTAASLQAPLLWSGAKALRFSLLQEKSTKKIRSLVSFCCLSHPPTITSSPPAPVLSSKIISHLQDNQRYNYKSDVHRIQQSTRMPHLSPNFTFLVAPISSGIK